MISLYLDIMISFLIRKVNTKHKKEIEQIVQSLTVLKNAGHTADGFFYKKFGVMNNFLIYF